MIKQSLLAHLREEMNNMRIADRTVIETDQGNIVRYTIWYMNSPHVLSGTIDIPEEAEEQFSKEENLPLQRLHDYLDRS